MGIYSLNKLYSVQEVAEKLNLSEQTVRKLIKKGEIQSIRLGKNIRITTSELHRIVENTQGK